MLSYSLSGTKICLLFRLLFWPQRSEGSKVYSLTNPVKERWQTGQMLHDLVTQEEKGLLMMSHIPLLACGPLKLKQCVSERVPARAGHSLVC